jgi:hypothetical protein
MNADEFSVINLALKPLDIGACNCRFLDEMMLRSANLFYLDKALLSCHRPSIFANHRLASYIVCRLTFRVLQWRGAKRSWDHSTGDKPKWHGVKQSLHYLSSSFVGFTSFGTTNRRGFLLEVIYDVADLQHATTDFEDGLLLSVANR